MYDQAPEVEERQFENRHGLPTINVCQLRDGIVAESRTAVWIFAKTQDEAKKLVKFKIPGALPLFNSEPELQATGYIAVPLDGGPTKAVHIVTTDTPGFAALHEFLLISYSYSGSALVKLKGMLYELTK